MMDYDEKIQILRACSSKKGERCSSCPAFGKGNRNCMRNAMKDAANAIERLQADLARVTAERDGAIKDLKKWNICATCGHYSPYGKKSNCKIKSAHISGGNWAGCSEWEWCGIKED